MTVFCQQLRRWISGGGDSEVDTRSESWRFEDRGAGAWELGSWIVVTSSLVVAFLVLVFSRPVATEDPRRRPTWSVVVLHEHAVDATGADCNEH